MQGRVNYPRCHPDSSPVVNSISISWPTSYTSDLFGLSLSSAIPAMIGRARSRAVGGFPSVLVLPRLAFFVKVGFFLAS